MQDNCPGDSSGNPKYKPNNQIACSSQAAPNRIIKLRLFKLLQKQSATHSHSGHSVVSWHTQLIGSGDALQMSNSNQIGHKNRVSIFLGQLIYLAVYHLQDADICLSGRLMFANQTHMKKLPLLIGY